MIRLPQYGSLEEDGRKSDTFEYPHEILQQLPAYESHPSRRPAAPLITTYHD